MAIDWDSAVLAPLEKVFGELVTYLPAIGNSFPVFGVFDEAYREVDLAGGMAVTTEMPILGIRLSLFAIQPKQGDQLTILRTNVTYVVKEVRPDSHGAAKLMLNQVSL